MQKLCQSFHLGALFGYFSQYLYTRRTVLLLWSSSGRSRTCRFSLYLGKPKKVRSLLMAFIKRHSPLSSRLTALAYDSTWVNSFLSGFLFYFIALFSALEKTHCAWMWFCMNEWLFIARIFFISAGGVLTALAWLGATWNCCHLGPFCVHHTTMHRVTSCKATHVRCMPI